MNEKEQTTLNRIFSAAFQEFLEKGFTSASLRNIAKKAAKSGVPILTITDSDTSPAAAHSTLLLLCPTSTKLFYNSMTAPMAMLNILASCLVIDSVSPSERQIFIDTLPS